MTQNEAEILSEIHITGKEILKEKETTKMNHQNQLYFKGKIDVWVELMKKVENIIYRVESEHKRKTTIPNVPKENRVRLK